MYATLASRDVDCCLIPESPFYLEGTGGLYEYIEKRLKENGHMVIVIAEGAGQELVSESVQSMSKQDASGNKLFQDVGLWISQKIRVRWLFILFAFFSSLLLHYHLTFFDEFELKLVYFLTLLLSYAMPMIIG